MRKLVELMGGINSLIGRRRCRDKAERSVVEPGCSKPIGVENLCRVDYGSSGGFRGEVILAENCHRGAMPWKAADSGWLPRFERNSDVQGINNFNELCADLKQRYDNRFSVCHWINVDAGGKRVPGPAAGNGYVYCDGTMGCP